MQKNTVLLIVAAGMILSSCTLFRHTSKVNAKTDNLNSTISKGDTTKKADSAIVKIRPYKEVITEKAKTDKGLFTVHQIEAKYFFEIPDTLLNKDILIVSRIAQAASDNRPLYKNAGYAGDQIGESVIQFSKGPANKLFIKTISYTERSLDSSENGMYRTVRNSNLQPIVASFDVKAYTPDSSGSVVEVTDFINSDNSLLYFDATLKGGYGLGAFQKDKSYIEKVLAFPINVEVQVVNTYVMGNTTATYGLNTSFVLLPEIAMKPRYRDDRVGYFWQSYMDFDKAQGVEETKMITRWRLEPKDEDKDKYLRGELVEPKKPIVYYIDPATPKKWVSYLIQGVNDWQKAFEKAGFKNAIYALEAPKNDSTFSLLDARHSAIVYKASVLSNASGPHVHDPRTGEILETHINWYHNVMQLIHDWYMIQAGANDPMARKMVFDDSLMGQLIRFVSSHEVGHTLGLMHNFGASSTVPVDSLRSSHYLEVNGFCPSIMDYARFNYVSQPQDSIPQKDLFPRINMYDEWAIDWGYRWLPKLRTPEEEKAYMDQWITNQLNKDKRYWYGAQPAFFVTDPRCQSEDLGDDAMKAGNYGIANLKRVMEHLTKWTKETHADFSSLERMNNQLINQYYRYVMHVTFNIGLYTWTPKTSGQNGSIVNYTPREKQKRGVAFLHDQVFSTPYWLINKDIFSMVGGYGAYLPGVVQDKVIYELMNQDLYGRMILAADIAPPGEKYTFDELLTDLEKGIWKELTTKASVDFYRRRLQKIYVERLVQMNDASSGGDNPFIQQSNQLKLKTDYITIVQKHIRKIVSMIEKALPQIKNEETGSHLVSMRNRLKQLLDPNAPLNGVRLSIGNTLNINSIDRDIFYLPLNGQENKSKQSLERYRGCWEDKAPF